MEGIGIGLPPAIKSERWIVLNISVDMYRGSVLGSATERRI